MIIAHLHDPTADGPADRPRRLVGVCGFDTTDLLEQVVVGGLLAWVSYCRSDAASQCSGCVAVVDNPRAEVAKLRAALAEQHAQHETEAKALAAQGEVALKELNAALEKIVEQVFQIEALKQRERELCREIDAIRQKNDALRERHAVLEKAGNTLAARVEVLTEALQQVCTDIDSGPRIGSTWEKAMEATCRMVRSALSEKPEAALASVLEERDQAYAQLSQEQSKRRALEKGWADKFAAEVESHDRTRAELGQMLARCAEIGFSLKALLGERDSQDLPGRPAGFHPDWRSLSDCPKCGRWMEFRHQCQPGQLATGPRDDLGGEVES